MAALTQDVEADLRRENARLQAELRAARDRQNASAEILRTIAGVSGDAERSLHQIAETTARLFGASSVTIRIASADGWVQIINVGPGAKRIGAEVRADQLRIGGRNLPGTVVHENRQIHIPDINNVDPAIADWPGLPPARAAGSRVIAGTPLRREGKAIGALIVHRDRLEPFTAEELALQQSFADQAVIAIENARLFKESQEALERQTATAEILKVIAGSPSDVQPVFDAIAESAKRLAGGHSSTVTRVIGDMIHLAAFTAGSEAGNREVQASFPTPLSSTGIHSRVARAGEIAFRTDMENEPDVTPAMKELARARGYRSILVVPMLRDGVAIGTISVTRRDPGPFADNVVGLLRTFADQAVIAIENVRLFNETKEALARQTATAEILRVISQSPTDVRPAFDAIVLTAVRLLRCDTSFVLRTDGTTFWSVGRAGPEGPQPIIFREKAPVDPAANFPSRAIVEKKTLHLPDWSAIDLPEHERRIHETLGINSALFMPLLREGRCIGVLAIAGKKAGMFGESEIALAESFRDQALIAIENTRLFNETKEALERQTATAEILKVIASSPSDVQPVFEAIATSANRLIGGFSTAVFRFIDGIAHLTAFTPTTPEADDVLRSHFPRPVDGFEAAEMAQRGRPGTVTDTEEAADRRITEIGRARGFRSMLFVPLMNNDVPIGLISVTRVATGSFADHHVQLLQTFADQAVIAIENVRLFDEVQAKTRDLTEALTYQTGSSKILGVIASSPTDVGPVLEAIVESACELCEAYDAVVWLRDGIELRFSAHHGPIPVRLEKWPINRNWVIGRSVIDRVPVHIQDVFSAEGDDFPEGREHSRLQGTRTILSVPLLREGESLGAIALRRTEVHPFNDKQIALLQTFADQAVIAIENVRLFNETKEALERQTATADILKVIASSPSDVQPVFEAIATSSNRLIGGFSTAVLRFIGDQLHLAAFTPTNATADEALKASFPRPLAEFPPFMLVRDGETVTIVDTEADDVPHLIKELARLRGYRSMLYTPLMSGGMPNGLISVTRKEPGTFAAHHMQLVRTFADQAVIAIENVRLFDEVQAKTHDLTEALTYQTGSGKILGVIASSPTDVGPVLNAIVESACELCEAYDAIVVLKDGGDLRIGAHHGPIPTNLQRWPNSRDSVSGLAMADRQPVHMRDVLSDERAKMPIAQRLSRQDGCRTILGVPMLREGESIGAIMLRRTEVHPFSDKQIALLQTFADQAVIAIGNVRLFDEVQARTQELTESLEQQTATSEVLSVISSSAGDLVPVFDAMLGKAMQLCGADFGVLNTFDGELFHTAATRGLPPAYDKYRRSQPLEYGPGTAPARLLQGEPIVEIPDLLESDAYRNGEPNRRALVDLGGALCLLAVPLLKDEHVVGNVMIFRQEKRRFSEKQISLLKQFAAQAVIAIENARLLNELRQRTNDLTASLEDLRTAQDRLIQTEKLASLGQLTAGIAHEIKNPLNFVNNFSALSAELTDELNDVLKSARLEDNIREEVDELTGLLKDNLGKVVQHGRRADSIVKNMLLHSREGSGEHRPADINALVDESLNLAYHGARAEKPQFNVTLQRNFDPNAGMIEAFPQEITRVFLNLISNGFYAVTKRKADNGGAGFEPVVSATTKDRGDQVEIRIRDNGTGIPAEVKEKMFNPFFTTKPAGEGTGLGLSMSHDIIVKQHGGTIDVDTEPGQFTEFRIVLPRTSIFSNKSRG